ncbi:MAG: sulfite exporter TauE/SafE family protein [Bacteroidales bacterium]|nr:sulfite exporter TauE/SafE family protein [Bacteroidales bacterium]
MIDVLYNFLDNSDVKIFSAFVLGILNAISPCPLITNISAIGFLSKDIKEKKLVFSKSILFLLGRAIVYIGIAQLIYLVLDKIEITSFLNKQTTYFIGSVFLIIGILLFKLPAIKKVPKFININSFNKIKLEKLNSFLLGMFYSLIFCPSSAFLK